MLVTRTHPKPMCISKHSWYGSSLNPIEKCLGTLASETQLIRRVPALLIVVCAYKIYDLPQEKVLAVSLTPRRKSAWIGSPREVQRECPTSISIFLYIRLCIFLSLCLPLSLSLPLCRALQHTRTYMYTCLYLFVYIHPPRKYS